jgi:D-alanyl-D-alanine carboxypeptidase/D-alanyl-D-alanine-endopeptidase (penicillin-binding protein 4)
MKLINLVVACAALGVVSSVSAAEAIQLPASVEAAMQRHKVPQSSVSIVVQDVTALKPLLALNATTPRNPASTIKLLTTWLALEHLGPAWVWPTDAYLDGDLVNGTLKGDLVLKGYGDPYFITERLWGFQRELKKRGLNNIEGDLIIDNSFFANEYEDPAAFDGRGLRVYNVNPDALLVNFQAMRFELLPNPATGRVTVLADPMPANLSIVNRLKLRPGRCGGYQNGVGVTVADSPARDTIILSGNYGTNCDLYGLTRSALTAPAFASGVFMSLWKESGGNIVGSWQLGKIAEDAEYFARVESPPLSDVIEYVNKYSNNVMARHLLLTIGADIEGAPASRAKGRRAAQQILSERGMNFPELVVDNGAGLSRQTRIAASSLAQVLMAATKSPWEAEYISSLSLSGLDGTMRKKFRDEELTGQMHLKSGRLQDVFALAGYVHARSGKDFIVVILQNYSQADRGLGEAVQSELIRWIYEQ